MRRVIAVPLLIAALGAAGCGSTAKGPAGQFASLGCSSCHTLKAARSTGRDGPNLDKSKPSYARIVDAITKGSSPTKRWPTGMPAYSGRAGAYGELTKARIQDLAAFIYTATHS